MSCFISFYMLNVKMLTRSFHGRVSPRLRGSKFLGFDASDRLSLGYNKPRKRSGLLRLKIQKKVDVVRRRTDVMSLFGSFEDAEKRLDVNIWRSTLSYSRLTSSRLVTGGFVSVNGKRVNHPGYLLSPGDLITLSTIPVGTICQHPNSSRRRSLDVEGVFGSYGSDLFVTSIGLPRLKRIFRRKKINKSYPIFDPYPLHLMVDSPSMSFVYLDDAGVLPRVVSLKKL